MESYRTSARDGLCSLLACCFTAAPEHGASSASGDDGMYLSQQQQQQQQSTRRLPWFLSTAGKDSISTTPSSASVAQPSSSSVDDVLATSRTAIGAANQPPPRWVNDDRIAACQQCATSFDLFTRKHHCRACGLVFCTVCTAHRERVVQFGFTEEPVRVCLACAVDARLQNAFFETHLPLLERGAVFTKHGLLLKRFVAFSFVRSKLLFQYQTLDADTMAPLPNEIKAFSLDHITDVQAVSIDKENGMLGILILVGPTNEAHRLDAATPEQKQQWLVAIESLRTIRQTLVTRENDRRAKQAEAQHAELRKMTESMKMLEERKASFHQERIQKRAEQREVLRAKYKLGASSSSQGNATTAAV